MKQAIQLSDVKTLISLAIEEDIGAGDITSRAIVTEGDVSGAAIVSHGQGIFCGTDMVTYVYEMIDDKVAVTAAVKDGDTIREGRRVIALSGPTASILSGERIVLNFLQRMTGIATKTARIVSLLHGTNIQILDTRKTLPGFRALDKYAVRIGGGTNHRMGLYDMIMIKDNHIRAAGSITKAVGKVRERYGKRYLIEVEAATLEEVREAVEEGADIIMLDNMDRPAMKAAVELIKRNSKIEVSGTMNEERIKEIIDMDVDYISLGSLTHSVQAFDLSMEFDV
jgi:nicotinate-nucleotide pyrophosphorylase (carboxylating)